MSDTLTPIRPRRPRTRRARAALDGGFYAELLHIAGLRESVAGARRGIERHEPSARMRGSLIELALERVGAQASASSSSSPDEAQRHALALRVCIAWISRLVVLKVLETRYVALNDGNAASAFLSARTLGSFRDLGALCEAVFGPGDPSRDARFSHLPRLDAALFDTDLDARLIDMGTLDDSATLPRSAQSALDDTAGARSGEPRLLYYLLDFFAAFDFSTGVARRAVSTRPCIDAAALGLVFEKLNGYRDGAWYTPANVAMELARAAITRAVLNAFNRAHGTPYENVDRLKDQLSESISQRDAAREIFDSIRVCDPAVGSGHLLVSALNELLALKAQLGLLDALGDRTLTVAADRLCLARANGEPLFAQGDRETLREIDAMLYREKRRIVEQSLFGVDIDADSVCMARVRLTIELLEHADFTERLPGLTANLTRGNAALSDVDIAAPSHGDETPFSWRAAFPSLFARNGDTQCTNGFDAVIANPPYIDSERMINAGQKPLRDALARRWPSAKGNWDLYVVFMELGLALLKPGGAMAYLTPDKWLAKPFGEAFRARHLRKIERIVALGRGVFDEARVDAIVTIFRESDVDTVSTARLDGDALAELAHADKTTLAAPWTLDALLSPHYAFARRLALAHPALGTLLGCENACATADAYRLAPLIDEAGEDVVGVDLARHYRVVNTGTLARYVPRWRTKPMTYLGRQYLAPVVDRARFAATFTNGYGAKASAKKVIVKGLTRLDAALDLAGDTIPGKTTLILRSHDDALLKFAAALLNCPLSAFLIRAQYGASSYNGGVAFTKAMIDALPAPSDAALRARIVTLVDRWLAFAQAHDEAGAEAVAREIDMTIYAAFGLTEEEIDVVEKRA